MSSTEQALKEAFDKHSDELFRHAYLRLSDRERALELTQETFLRTWEYMVKGGEVKQYRSFLYRTLHNLIVDEYRKHRTQSLEALLENEDASLSVEGDLLRDDFDLVEEANIRFDAKRAVAALNDLPEPYRIVLVLRYIDGLSPPEIAECINDNENAVSVRIHRGLRKLRDMLTS